MDYMTDRKQSLLELAHQTKLAHKLEQALLDSNGEITEEIELFLAQVVPVTNSDLALKDKVDSYRYVMDRLEDASNYWKTQSNARRIIADACDRSRDQLRARLKIAMGKLGTKELVGHEYRFRVIDTQKRLVIQNELEIPSNYLVETVEFKPDKARIKDALEKGESVPGCNLEGGTAIRSYLNKENKKENSHEFETLRADSDIEC